MKGGRMQSFCNPEPLLNNTEPSYTPGPQGPTPILAGKRLLPGSGGRQGRLMRSASSFAK